ncbi:hypothetical protein HMF8227_02261 [Saliniradius amylolyticus]|uniref:TetR family transcriptional regulator n=2 Tax=Saliniradius amylolyticus TaxID=2183582 RepID=A0A2S2E4Z0_9ALTE|nr:hypothetical protein HMF8227_02261 [Saliniradius amylolyticus]
MLSDDTVLNKALELARSTSWEDFNINELAIGLDISLSDLYRCVRSRDDLADLLFDRADTNMLDASQKPGFIQQTAEARLAHCISSWLETLAPYKPLVREMLGYKLEPGHIHLQAHGITRISRTVQWFLTAARWQPQGLSRIVTELGVTSVYVITFGRFLSDDKLNPPHLKAQLQARLQPLAPPQ